MFSRRRIKDEKKRIAKSKEAVEKKANTEIPEGTQSNKKRGNK